MESQEGKGSKTLMVSGSCHVRSKVMLLILCHIRNLFLLSHAISAELCSPSAAEYFIAVGSALEMDQSIKHLLCIHEALSCVSPEPV